MGLASLLLCHLTGFKARTILARLWQKALDRKICRQTCLSQEYVNVIVFDKALILILVEQGIRNEEETDPRRSAADSL